MQPEVQNFDGTCAAKRVRDDKLEARQKLLRGKVLCEGEVPKNVFRFEYLGVIFSANGDQTYDIKRRISLAMTHIHGSTSSCVQLENRVWSENAGLQDDDLITVYLRLGGVGNE